MERLIVNRPHPWGLLITFIELIKVISPPREKSSIAALLLFSGSNFSFGSNLKQNPRYNFWNRGFIRCAPEIEKLFESVSRSCGGPKPVDESMVSGWVPDNAH